MIKRDQVIGMNQHYKRFSLDYFLNAQEKEGIQNIELWLSAPHYWLDSFHYEDCKTILKKIKARNLKIVATISPSMDYQYQYAHPEPDHRKKSIEYFKNGIKATADLGATMMSINSGWGYWNGDHAEAWRKSQDTIGNLLEVAKHEGVTLVLESLAASETQILNNLEKTIQYFQEINHSSLQIMIDTVAMRVAGETMQQWFEAFGSHIKHMHFVDGKSSCDHFAWGDGDYPLEDFISCLNKYNYAGYLSQEITAPEYLDDPISADRKNMRTLGRFIND
jgi:fructoselysine 3-epimerase